MKTTMLRRVRRLYNVDYIPREINRANQRKWVRSVRLLGRNWLLAEYVSRKVISNAQTQTQA
jgi:hypothetical protein